MATKIFEVCAFNIQSCLIAEKAGSQRVELCDNPVEGGTTPSYGTIRQVREKVNIHLFPIIRPRAGNYWYDDNEFNIIREDIKLCRELGCDGISVGVQQLDGTIHTERLKQIVAWAGPMSVTCNRVFDTVPDPYAALEEIIACGCARVLTSGQATAAPEAAALLAELVRMAGDRIIIMPGAGINASNIEQLIKDTGAQEYHGSARKAISNPVHVQNPRVADFGQVFVTDEDELRAIMAFL